jgi:hypothetical protein
MNNIRIRHAPLVIALLIVLLTSGCATIVKGSSQGVTVKTDPPGAICDLTKNGKSMGVVNPTPGTVQLGKGGKALDVTCRKSGYLDSSATLTSSFQGWTLGNLVLGGIVGLVVDAGSGAAYQYRSEIFLKLQPEGFASVESRDAYFDAWRDELLADSGKTKAEIAARCPKDQCAKLIEAVDAKTRNTVSGLEASRQRARIVAADGSIVQSPVQ